MEWVIPNPTGFLVNGVPISDPSGFNVPDVHCVMATVSLVDQIAVLIADFSQRKFGEAQYISGSRMSFIIGDKLGPDPSLADVVPFFPPLSLLLPGGAILTMSPTDYLDLSGSDVLTPGTPTLHANVALGKAWHWSVHGSKTLYRFLCYRQWRHNRPDGKTWQFVELFSNEPTFVDCPDIYKISIEQPWQWGN